MTGGLDMIWSMARILLALALGSLACFGQQLDRSRLKAVLSFETEQPGGMPTGWSGGPAETISVDGKIVHGGRWSARIERNAHSSQTFSALTSVIPVDFTGKTLELRGFIRTENVTEFAGLWMREDGDSMLEFDNMQRRQLKGTSDWAQYSISLPLHQDAMQLYFGFLLTGAGKAWVDDLSLLVDGKPVWEAASDRPKTAPDLDHAFDAGSGLALSQLSPVQIENLVTLGKVWGFVKYHHPQVTSGNRHWDFDLFRVLPAVLAAASRAEASASILHWIDALGAVPPCSTCASLNATDLYFRPDVDWISNEPPLGPELSQRLQSIYRNRSGKQFYVSLTQNVGNPSFDHELGYPAIKLPDAGYQLLAVYRFWNLIEYWFPYRDVLGEDWDKVLAEFIPKVALAKSSEAYQLQLMALIGHAHDTHANLWSSLSVRPPVGKCHLPVVVRLIENQAVVTATLSKPDQSDSPKIGDVISEIDGKPLSEWIASWTPYYADSNEAARRRDMARSLTHGDCGPVSLRVQRASKTLELKATRVPVSGSNEAGMTHDMPGAAFRLLSPNVAYMKLGAIKSADVAGYIEKAAGTKGLIIDNRNYPSDFPIFSLGQLLVSKETPFARFTAGDLSNPGAFYWGPSVSLRPQQPHYAGKIVILVDEVTQSSAEYHAMAFRSAPEAIVIGSMTAGADGNVSQIALPGGLRAMMSGIGVFYPDKRPTQRIGILPDVEVKPTLAGIQQGRDEVLEAALRKILGDSVPAAEIEKLAKPQVGN